jgi:hypothetical protein
MLDENGGALHESTYASLTRLFAEVGLALSVAFLLLADLSLNGPETSLQLHFALEFGAASVAIFAAACGWIRCAQLAARWGWRGLRPLAASRVKPYIDLDLWRAIERALRAESASRSPAYGRFPRIVVPPASPGFDGAQASSFSPAPTPVPLRVGISRFASEPPPHALRRRRALHDASLRRRRRSRRAVEVMVLSP